MSQPRNILLFLTDQHRLSALGAYGPTVCRTPNIDRLAAEGVLFERAYTVCPVCSPARGTIMTGLYPHGHGITSNIENLGCTVHALEDRPTLLSRRLEAAGYALGYTGKWHLGDVSDAIYAGASAPSLPRDLGFEGQNFPGHGGGGFRFPEYKTYLEQHGWEHRVREGSAAGSAIPEAGELEGPLESTVPWFLARNTIEMIDTFRDEGRPFFIWHNNWGPHAPYFATREFVDMYRDVEIPEWPNYRWPSRRTPGPHHVKIHADHERLDWENWATTLRYYYAFATMIDDQIGRIVRHLEETGLVDDTIILMTSDHGETIGSHGGLTDKGWHHFEETGRIPMIVRLPDRQGAGTRRQEFASLADVYPSVLDWAGAEPREDDARLPGASLQALVDGRTEGWRDDVVTEFGGVNSSAATMRALRWGDLKYGYTCGGPEELYDLARDPHETLNLIDHPDYRDAARELRARLRRWMKENRDGAGRMFETVLKYRAEA